MLTTFIKTEESYDAYLRPAIYDSIKAVLAFYKLESAANIYYNGRNDVAKLIGNSQDDGQNADRYTDGIFRNKVFIKASYNRSEFWSNRRMMTERPVLSDGGILPLRLCPAFENKRVEVTVTAMFNSDIDATNWKDQINRARENQIVDFNFSPINHMVVNNSIVGFFETLYDMVAKNEPGIKPPHEWLNDRWQAATTVVTNVKGNHPRLVVPLKANNVGIQFTEAFVAQAQKGATYGRWEVEFSYFFYLNDFIGWDLEYPLMVYQDEIPQAFISRIQPEHAKPNNVVAAPEVQMARDLAPPQGNVGVPYYAKFPAHDPWAYPGAPWSIPVVQARLSVDAVEQQELCNIFDIPFVWRDLVKNYVLRRHEYAFTQYHTPFLIQVFENDQRVDPATLSMDENGSITLHKAPNLRNTYRVVITTDYAIRDYADSLWDDLEANPDDWALMPLLFHWFDWSSVPLPWIQNTWFMRKHIAKGWGKWNQSFNIYEMSFNIVAHREQGRG